MQKIPTMFLRDKTNPKLVTREVDPECQWVVDGEGVATVKFDGSACAVIDGYLYKRHQHKAEKGDPPKHWVHWSRDLSQRSGHGWLLCATADPSARYHLEAWKTHEPLDDGTYELVGPKSNGNPHGLPTHQLWRHGSLGFPDVPREFDALKLWLAEHGPMEGAGLPPP